MQERKNREEFDSGSPAFNATFTGIYTEPALLCLMPGSIPCIAPDNRRRCATQAGGINPASVLKHE